MNFNFIQGIHSEFNATAKNEDECVCDAPIFPLKTTVKDTLYDIVDEAIKLYRLNVLYKNFTIEGRADIILVYLMAFIAECLNALPKPPCTKTECKKIFQSKVFTGLELPGSRTFNLGMLFSAPNGEKEHGKFEL